LESLSDKNSFLALSISVLFLSLTGFPPFLGFWSKFYICSTVIGEKIASIIYAATIISNLICIAKISEALWFRKNNEIFFIGENTTDTMCLFAGLAIVAVPFAYKLSQFIGTELLFAR
jgi:NADH:ubiquinone oxidoreductase subunit 2 (subunit N)